MACQSTKLQDFYRRCGITRFATGPDTPWPNRAEAAVRVFKTNLHDLSKQIGNSSEFIQVKVRELLGKTASVRNSMVIYGENTPVELVFGRRPRDVITIGNSSPEHLTLPTSHTGQLEQTLQKYGHEVLPRSKANKNKQI